MSWLLLSRRCLSFLHFDSSGSSSPVKLLNDKSRKLSSMSWPNSEGMLLVRRLCARRRQLRFLDMASSEGMGPEKLLFVKSNALKEFEPVRGKMVPLNLLCEKFMILRFLSRYRDAGRGPSKELL